jgi:hypothetical protein
MLPLVLERPAGPNTISGVKLSRFEVHPGWPKTWEATPMRTLMQTLIFAAALLALFVASSGEAFAQPAYPGPGGYRPNNPPAYSPYLNLLRAGNSAGVNYYGLVRPELEFRGAYQGLQQQFNQQQNAGQTATDQFGLPVTGHTATFLNTGGYFLNLSGGGAGMGAAGQKNPGIGGMGGQTPQFGQGVGKPAGGVGRPGATVH